MGASRRFSEIGGCVSPKSPGRVRISRPFIEFVEKSAQAGEAPLYSGGEELLLRAGGAGASAAAAAAADAVSKYADLATRCISAWGQCNSAV